MYHFFNLYQIWLEYGYYYLFQSRMSGEEHKNGDITDGAVKGKGKKGKKGKVEVCYIIL